MANPVIRSTTVSPSPLNSQRSETKSEKSLPFPFMEAYIERRNGVRFGRRVKFDHSEYDNFLEKIVEQRDEKRNKDFNDKRETLEREKDEAE